MIVSPDTAKQFSRVGTFSSVEPVHINGGDKVVCSWTQPASPLRLEPGSSRSEVGSKLNFFLMLISYIHCITFTKRSRRGVVHKSGVPSSIPCFADLSLICLLRRFQPEPLPIEP